MKKIGKMILSSLMALALVLSVVTPATMASAQEEKVTYLKNVPGKKHCIYNKYSSNEYTIAEFNLENYDNKIYVKCSSKNMYAGVTHKNSSYSKSSDQVQSSGNVRVSAVFKKAGNYKVTVTEKTAKGKVVFTKNIKVYCNTSSPVKKLTLNGKVRNYSYVTMKSAKAKVTMNKGYKLKKIEYGVYKKNSNEMVWKAIKNGGKVVFGKYPYHSGSKNEYGDKDGDYYSYYEYYSENLVADTFIRITYIDKYTKENDTVTYHYYRYLK